MKLFSHSPVALILGCRAMIRCTIQVLDRHPVYGSTEH